ncbi:dockerin type I domain-containing protein [Ruminococcus champanellensis]
MNRIHRIHAGLLATVCAAAMLPGLSSSAAKHTVLKGYRGDLNQDQTVTIADAVILSKHLTNAQPLTAEYGLNADADANGTVDGFDLAYIKRICLGFAEPIGIYEEIDVPDTQFIDAPIKEVKASLPSQGEAELVIFYVDFPDCQYTYDPSAEYIDQIAFGSENTESAIYPFESMRAFYSRSSKGAMELSGKTFRYTTKENASAYGTDKVKLAKECYEAFKDSEDFTKFDGNGDGKIDATLFTVPTAAGDTDWWPCAGAFGDESYRVDGMAIGHIITGNAQIESETDYKNFVSSYLHEMGHCMGLPDYYLYWGTDSEGMHGAAGIELMDTDASSDFGAFSKLMLGWYQSDQIAVYDNTTGTQTFTLHNAQTQNGNCVIIPCGELDGQYFSEYFVIEYASAQANNSSLPWWQTSGSGVRIYHINATLQRDYWYTYLKYQNGTEYNNDGVGIRAIRIVNDTDGDNFFHQGDVINNSVSGFGWYDSSENESMDPGVTITVGALENDAYTITITK